MGRSSSRAHIHTLTSFSPSSLPPSPPSPLPSPPPFTLPLIFQLLHVPAAPGFPFPGAPPALAMPFGPFRGDVPENDIVVAEDYLEDFLAAIAKKKDKRRKAKTDAARLSLHLGPSTRVCGALPPVAESAPTGAVGTKRERDLEQTPESKKGQRIASDCGRASASQTPESSEKPNARRPTAARLGRVGAPERQCIADGRQPIEWAARLGRLRARDALARREAKRQKGDGCAPGSSGAEEWSEGSTSTSFRSDGWRLLSGDDSDGCRHSRTTPRDCGCAMGTAGSATAALRG